MRAPRFGDPVDVEANIARLPSSAALRGFFINDALARARAKSPSADLHALAGTEPRRYLPFLNYPYGDYLRLLHVAAGVIEPNVPRGEALRRLGWTTYDLFLGTSIGRAIFGMLGGDVESILLSAARGYSVSINFGRVTSERLSAGHVVVKFRELPAFLEQTQVGVIEGAVRHCGKRPEVELDLMDLANADLHVRW